MGQLLKTNTEIEDLNINLNIPVQLLLELEPNLIVQNVIELEFELPI